MTKRSRNRVRNRGKLVLNDYNRMVSLFAYSQTEQDWRDWTVRRTVSLHEAKIMEASGDVERITRGLNGLVELIGFRDKKATMCGAPSATTLTLATMKAVGNEGGVPSEEKYAQTRRERLEVIKFRVWPLIGDTRAVCVRPRLTAIEQHFAEKLLSAGRLRVSRCA